MQASSYDIIIVGGGIVGCALACALAQHTSLSIAILEAQTPTEAWTPTAYHPRVSAIALSSQRIFQSLHIWNAIKGRRISPFQKIQVWDDTSNGNIEFDCKEVGEKALGYIIENNVIQTALLEKIKQYPQVTMLAPIEIVAMAEQENRIDLTTHDGCVYSAKLAIAADGANSWLRAHAGIDIKRHDYQQQAIVTTVQTALPHDKVARQVFLPSGPLAFLPLADANTSSIVWSLPVEEATRLHALDVNEFKLELAHAFSQQLGAVLEVERRYLFPLHKQQTKHYVKSRIVLVGDAAHTVHPLAGQGVNMGLLDAASLAEIIIETLQQKRDFTQPHILRRYERWRKADNLALLAGVDVIKGLFASNKKVVQTVRSLGLNVTNQLQWFKNVFTRHAIGDRNGLPKMARMKLD